ncbi:preprotein translocase subunit SecF [Corynebacterium deserti GIMN1.010]|uniref:Protein-export membrane protein SecF n=1 Tax=Corynebacterium deserti GIMN1.010 TaxID=931089 RepID=A0A0M4CM65_9CORY|nr:protein translocase subunit SecF [Corynebacterium deserti]ALC06060.1 preprotein translocase subunit SecF [Corynebacterium deserti GIMN1.010]
MSDSTATHTTKPVKNTGWFNSLYTGDGGIDFIGKTKLWYWITGILLIISVLFIAIRGFSLSIDFEGGTKMNMPAADYSVEAVEETFTEATGITPEIVQIVGSGDARTLEIHSERLSDEDIEKARLAIYEEYQPLNSEGQPSPDAIGNSTVSESWGSTITQRMVLALVAFLVIAAIYIAFRLEREMAIAAMAALIVDGIVIAGIYAVIGLEVSPATVIGLLTVLTFSIYDTVVVFDKVRENTEGYEGSRRRTYAEQANLAVNQTFMRSISTTIISALPIIALMVVAVWMMGVGTLKDLALIQLIGVIEGTFSSVFLATPLLVSLKNRLSKTKAHTASVMELREGKTTLDDAAPQSGTDAAGGGVGGFSGEEAAGQTTTVTNGSPKKRTVSKPVVDDHRSSGTWRPGRS